MIDSYYDTPSFRDLLKRYEQARDTGELPYLEMDELSDLSDYYHMQGDDSQALALMDHAHQLYPTSAAPWVFRARLALIEDKDVTRAHQLAEQISDKGDVEYTYIKAEILLFDHHDEMAEKLLEARYQEIDDISLREDFAFEASRLLTDYDATNYALKWFERVPAGDDRDFLELKAHLTFLDEKYDESEQLFTKLLDQDPYSLSYWNTLAAIQYEKGQYEQSLTSSEYALAIHPGDEEAILNKANCLYVMCNYEEALNYYRRFDESLPEGELIKMDIGLTLLNLDRLEEGLLFLHEAEQRCSTDSPNLRTIYEESAFALSRLGRFDEAMSYVDKAETLTDNHSDALVLRGYVYLDNEQPKEARKYFGEALEASGHSQEIYLRIAIAFFEHNYFLISYEMFHTLLSNADDNWTEGYGYMALCCKLLNDDEGYLRYLDAAREKCPMELRHIGMEHFTE